MKIQSDCSFPKDRKEVIQAIRVASEAHRNQYREGKGEIPYCHHPVEVALILYEVGAVEDTSVLVAAILHDCLEETPLELSKINELFGHKIARLVKEVTREEPTAIIAKELSKADLYKLRTETLIQEIRQMSQNAHLIKLADRISNYKNAKKYRTKKKLNRYKLQTLAILDVIPRSVSPRLWDYLYSLVTQKKTNEFDNFESLAASIIAEVIQPVPAID